MKKLAIAASAVALAALPVVGVFATDAEITDTLQITVDPSCTFKEDATTDGVNTKDTVYSAASVAGGSQADFSAIHGGTHDFEFTCNDTDGFRVTATPTNMTSWNTTSNAAGTGDGVITFTPYATYSANSGITGGTERNGMWTAHIATTEAEDVITLADPTTADTGTVIVTKNEALGQAKFSAAYSVYAGTSTPADTYRGTITYVLAAI